MNLYDLLIMSTNNLFTSFPNLTESSTVFDAVDILEDVVLLEVLHLNTLYTTGILLDLRTSPYGYKPSNVGLLIARKTLSLDIKSNDRLSASSDRLSYQFNVGASKLEKNRDNYRFIIYDYIMGGREIIVTTDKIAFFFLALRNLPEVAISMDELGYQDSIPHWFTPIEEVQGFAFPKF